MRNALASWTTTSEASACTLCAYPIRSKSTALTPPAVAHDKTRRRSNFPARREAPPGEGRKAAATVAASAACQGKTAIPSKRRTRTRQHRPEALRVGVGPSGSQVLCGRLGVRILGRAWLSWYQERRRTQPKKCCSPQGGRRFVRRRSSLFVRAETGLSSDTSGPARRADVPTAAPRRRALFESPLPPVYRKHSSSPTFGTLYPSGPTQPAKPQPPEAQVRSEASAAAHARRERCRLSRTKRGDRRRS